MSPTFDRFDICEAYYVFEIEWNKDGWLHERPSNQRRNEATHVQLHRIGYRPGMASPCSFDGLEENAKAIYVGLLDRYGFAYPADVRAWLAGGVCQCQHEHGTRGGICDGCGGEI